MGLTIYQSITPAEKVSQSSDEKSSLCGSGRGYTIKTWCGIRRSTCLLIMYVTAYFVFLVGGSLLFSHLEEDLEKDIKIKIDEKKDEFVKNNPGVNKEDLEKLIDEITYRAISPRAKDLNTSNWSFGQSLLFTVTVVTTIGNQDGIINRFNV